MSYILDALKKSERQRRHGEALIFKQVTPDTMPGFLRPMLFVLAGVALLVGAITAVYVLEKNPPVVATAVPNESRPAVPPAPIEDLAEQAAVENMSKASSAPAAPLSASTAAPAPVAAPSPVAGFGQVPWLSALPEVFRNSLPPLTVNIHVYTPEESQRILYINNRPVGRGEQIEGGVVMEEIVQDGVILRFRGQLFKLPRPK